MNGPYKQNGKWCLGCPDEKETLKQRYQKVLVGFERFSFSEEQLRLYMADFEIALADLAACMECKSVQSRLVKSKEDDEHPVTVRDDCQGATGHGLYLALHAGDCAKYKKPMFRAFPCGGPLARLNAIRTAMTRRESA